jgi:hypothetical protein
MQYASKITCRYFRNSAEMSLDKRFYSREGSTLGICLAMRRTLKLFTDTPMKPKRIRVFTADGSDNVRIFYSDLDFQKFIKKEGDIQSGNDDGPVSSISQLNEKSLYYVDSVLPRTIFLRTYMPAMRSEVDEVRTFCSQLALDKFLLDHRYLGPFERRHSGMILKFHFLSNQKSYFVKSEFSSFEDLMNRCPPTLEEEARKAAKREISKMLGYDSSSSNLVEIPSILYCVRSGGPLQTYDAIFYDKASDTIYLLDCRHLIQKDILLELNEKLEDFPEIIKRATSVKGNKDRDEEKSLSLAYSRVVGIACGGSFPTELRQFASNMGLLVMVPLEGEYSLGVEWKLQL